jgi:7-cyano-7-deazaguanine synthase
MRAAVLFSGGLDSAVLLAFERQTADRVWPVHVRSGFAWEEDEARVIDDLLASPPFVNRVEPVTTLTVDMRDVYPASHWAMTGQTPAYDTPDEDVYLEGRNITLIAKTAVLSARLGIERIAIGPLAGNPFPDATPAFLETMARALSLGLAHEVMIAAPFRDRHKEDVIALGESLKVPLERTLSCMSPDAGRHCGRCSKCRERQEAFRAAGVVDRTVYATPPPG